jgi:hypothetical protein
MITLASKIHHTSPPIQVKELKKKLLKNTFSTGTTVTGLYFLTQPANIGASSLIGTVSSLTYVHLLSQYVENVENSSFQKQLLVPVGMVLGESFWNQYHPSFELDFLTTFVGFFSYKLALFFFLLEIVKSDLMNGIED